VTGPIPPTATLKERAHRGDRLLGVLLRIPGEELVEMVALCGFDFILIDCEHGPADLVPLRQHIATALLHGCPVLVRVGSHEPALVLRALDHGANGIVAPHIDTANGAAELVASVHYPPLGRRGFAGYSRPGRYGLVPAEEHRQRMLAETLVFGMIESPAGVAATEQIVATVGLDGIMIGPADLRASSTGADPDLAASVARVHQVLAERRSLRLQIVNSTAEAVAAFTDGANLVVYNLTHTVMDHLAELRKASPPLQH
jgi:4-hydroxy-2-oxoheptanedioate aldolase